MIKRRAILLLIGLLCGLVLVSSALAQISTNYGLRWHVIGDGGGPMASTNYALNTTLSQPAIGPAISTNYRLGVGYWYGMVETVAPPARRIYLPIIMKNAP
jgi:hypothetical protein